jgi:MFS family permease
VSEQQASWVASLSLLGAFFGGMLGGLAMRFGRKRLLLITSLPFSASWLMTVFASSVEMMFATAFVGGFCCAIVLVVTQVNLIIILSDMSCHAARMFAFVLRGELISVLPTVT